MCLCGCFVGEVKKKKKIGGASAVLTLFRVEILSGWVEVKRQQQAVRRLFGPAGLTGGRGFGAAA